MPVRTKIGLFAGRKSSGQEVYEEVPAEELGGQRFRIVSSPGFVEGIAAGDVILLDRKSRGEFEVIERGGNLCIQVFGDGIIDKVDAEFSFRIKALGGWVDDKGMDVMVYTIPASVGFSPIEIVLAEIVTAFPDVSWCYGNVYDPRDGETLLNWWC